MGRVSNVETAYELIKDMIASKDLLPGQQITENDMSSRCGMSRTPIREALRLLERDGLIEIIPNKGAYLRSITRTDVLTCFEADAAMEGMAAYLLAEKVREGTLGKEELESIAASLTKMEELYEKGQIKEWVIEDEQYHSNCLALSANPLLIDGRKQIRAQLNQVLWFVTPIDVNKRISNEEHRRCFEAISAGDPEKAMLEAQRHRLRVRDIIRQTYL